MKMFKRAALVATLVLFGVACGGDKKKDAPPKKAGAGEACKANSDCQPGYACLNNECSGATTGTILKNPGNAVTPTKVKRQIEDIGAKRDKKMNKQLDGIVP